MSVFGTARPQVTPEVTPGTHGRAGSPRFADGGGLRYKAIKLFYEQTSLTVPRPIP